MKRDTFGKCVFFALVVIVLFYLDLSAVEVKLPQGAGAWITGKALYSYTSAAPMKVEAAAVKNIADSLMARATTGVSFDKMVPYQGGILYTSAKDPSAILDFEPDTGAFVFNAGMLKYSQEGITPGLPKSEQAITLAKKYLTDLNYFPKNEKELSKGYVGGLSMGVQRDDGSRALYQKLVTVYFGRVIDNLPVMGVGSRIVVHLGENGQLVGIVRNWVEVQKGIKAAAAQLRTDAEIKREILKQIQTDLSTAKTVNVDKSDLVLYDDGRGVIEPAIYVEALSEFEKIDPKTRKKETYKTPYDCYVPVFKSSKAYYPSLEHLDKTKPIAAPKNDQNPSGT